MDDDKYLNFLKDLAKHINPTSATVLPVLQAQGRYLAEDVIYNEQKDINYFAEVDGYAVAWSMVASASPENPVLLPLANKETEIINHALFAYKINKNDPLPFKTDTVITIDLLSNFNDGELHTELIEVAFKPLKKSTNTRTLNNDNSLKISKSQKLTPEVISLLLAHGVKEVKIFERPVVGLVWGSSANVLNESEEPVEKKENNLDRRYPAYWLGMLLQQNSIPVIDLGNIACNHERIDELLDKFSWQVDCLVWCGEPIEDQNIAKRKIPLEFSNIANLLNINSYMFDVTPTFEISSKIVNVNNFFNLVFRPLLNYMCGGQLKTHYLEPASPAFFNIDPGKEFCLLDSNYQPISNLESELDILNPVNKVEFVLSIWKQESDNNNVTTDSVQNESNVIMLSDLDNLKDSTGCIIPLGNIRSKTKTIVILDALELQEESNSTYIFDLISKKNEDQAAAALIAEEHSQASVQSAEELSANLITGMEANANQENKPPSSDRRQPPSIARNRQERPPIQGRQNRFERGSNSTEDNVVSKPHFPKPDRFQNKRPGIPPINHPRQPIERPDRPNPQHSVTFVHGNIPKKRFIPRTKPGETTFENRDDDD